MVPYKLLFVYAYANRIVVLADGLDMLRLGAAATWWEDFQWLDRKGDYLSMRFGEEVTLKESFSITSSPNLQI
jgi:hypothetical protein